MPPYANPQGEVYANESRGFFGLYVVPKRSVDAAKFDKLCRFLNFAYSEEGHNLGKYGIEGVHHNVVAGEIEMIPDAFDTTNSPSYNQILRKYERYGRAYGSSATPEHYEENKRLVDLYEEHAVGNPAIGIVSETEQESTVDYWGDIVEAKVKTIMGMMTIEEWDAFVDELLSSQEFQTIIEEYNAQYTPK
jgi:putative aldouronate transport system substrate-binding protein